MARAMLFLAILNILSSCQKQYRKCEIQTSDRYLNAYNEILNEIIVTSTYNYYLGDDEEVIFNMAGKGTYDSAEIESKVIRLHNRLFDDTARRCTLFLDTILRSKFEPQERFLNDSTSFARKLRNAIDEISHDHKTVVDSLNLVQTRYSANDYISCTAKMKSIRNARIDKSKCYVGKIAMSKIAFNDHFDKAVLYYEFVCGGLCGYGRVINCSKSEGQWKITGSIYAWFL